MRNQDEDHTCHELIDMKNFIKHYLFYVYIFF